MGKTVSTAAEAFFFWSTSTFLIWAEHFWADCYHYIWANGLLTNFLIKSSAEDNIFSRTRWGHGELWDGDLLAKGVKRLNTRSHRSAGSCKGREQLCVKKSRMVQHFEHPCRTQKRDSSLHCKFLGWNWECSLLSQTHISWRCVSFSMISTRLLRSC